VIGAGIAKGRIRGIDLEAARRAPGVITIVTAQSAGSLGKGKFNTAKLLGGPEIDHYHQAVALVVADTFEQARAAAALVRVEYERAPGRFDLAKARGAAVKPESMIGGDPDTAVGDFNAAFTAAPVHVDATYTTPDESHAMMEPHATIAAWAGDQLTVWTSNQMVDWSRNDLALTLNIPKEKVRLVSPFIGGGFGGKLFLRADALLAALGARAARRPVKVALQRALMINNTTHRPATIQRVRLGANRGWHADIHRARELVRRPPPGAARHSSAADPDAVCGCAQDDGHPSRHAGPARVERHARARRSHRPPRIGGGDGRTGRKARHGSRAAAHQERHAGGARPLARQVGQ
jgi:xanthine dehydrogenase YagR molybdenum-binding subunit